MSTQTQLFSMSSRLLHWTMAVMILVMLGIGAAMVASLGWYPTLISIHRLLGITILILVVIRFVNRLVSSVPPFPSSISRMEVLAAKTSEYGMYVLMFLLPLIGWGALSAAGDPIVLFGSVRLPAILPHNLALYAVLHRAHVVLAYAFFAVILCHLAAILFHTLILRDRILWRMAWQTAQRPLDSSPEAAPTETLVRSEMHSS